jgi:aminoglycoside phosphotransferase (APT) family kinase protein
VLDWEMATIGDPLADLGYLCMMWTEAGDPGAGCASTSAGSRASRGFPTREELIASLRAALGPLDARPALVHDARAVEVVVFMEGNYKRASPAPPTTPT